MGNDICIYLANTWYLYWEGLKYVIIGTVFLFYGMMAYATFKFIKSWKVK